VSNVLRLGVIGACGRMGREVVALAAIAEDMRLVAAIERPGHPDVGKQVLDVPITEGGAVPVADAFVDFSAPANVRASIDLARRANAALVVGSTGLGSDDDERLEEAAGAIPVLAAPNLALGVQVLYRLVAIAARALPDHDVEIVETHHRGKVDAPSGTARRLAAAVKAVRPEAIETHGRSGLRGAGEIGVHAVRGGDVVGNHEIVFAGEGEILEITHRATSRRAFAWGALEAVRFLVGRRPGRYSMDDIVTNWTERSRLS